MPQQVVDHKMSEAQRGRPADMEATSEARTGKAGMEISSDVLTGTGASPGTACGTARTVHNIDEFSEVRPGDVLVCRTTDPAWTPLFAVASAIITETGGCFRMPP